MLRALTDGDERRRWLGEAVPEPAVREAGRRVDVRHEGVAERRTGEGSFRDFWHLALANLRGLLESGEVAGPADLTPSRGDVRLEVDAAAPAAAVFRALVEPAELDRWIAERADVEPWVGGRYDFGWGDEGGPIRILELEPDRRLAYAWTYEDELGRTVADETVVEWTLEESGGRTSILLVHSGFAPDAVTDDYALGWLAFLASLKFMVEGGPAWGPPSSSRIAEVV